MSCPTFWRLGDNIGMDHSIAILTSERSQIDDARVQELACEIIVAQRREVAKMKWLIADLRENGRRHRGRSGRGAAGAFIRS